jgi:PKD repeat protein
VASIEVPSAPVHIDEQASYSVDVAFGDPAGANDEPYACGFDLDNDGVDDEVVSGVTGTSCSVTPNYATPGLYTVKVTVTDKDGGLGSETAPAYVVVYDPQAGFVSGGGWIHSPEGAYVPDPGLTGKATFDFVAKYVKGASIPTGQTQFQFRVADLDFYSDSYEWLVIAGARAKYKGTGTIDGEGNYGFLISAIDEALISSTDVDLFRIKIWDIGNADAVVYDNQIGAEEDADPTTTIGGGNIVIHKAKR